MAKLLQGFAIIPFDADVPECQSGISPFEAAKEEIEIRRW
jgi:hypothetical protein